MSIKIKLNVILPIIILVSLFTMGFFMFFNNGKTMLEQKSSQQAEYILSTNINYFNNFFEHQFEIIDILSENKILLSNDNEKILEVLFACTKGSQSVNGTFFAKQNKQILYTKDNGKVDIDIDPTVRPWYISAVKQKGEIILTEPYIDTTTEKPVITIARSVQKGDGEIIGVVGMDIFPDNLNKKIKNLSFLKTGFAFLLKIDKENGKIIANLLAHKHLNPVVEKQQTSSDASKYELRNFSEKSYIADIVEGKKKMLSHKSDEGENIIFYGKLKYKNWYLCLEAPSNEYYQDLQKIGFALFFSLFIFVIVIEVPIIIVSKQITKSIKEVKGFAKRIASGDFSIRSKQQTKNEIGEIVKAIEKLGNSINTLLNNMSDTSKEVTDSANLLKVSVDNSNEIIDNIMKSINNIGKEIMAQSSAVEKTGAVVEEMVNSIDLVATSVETQASAVSQSSSSVQEMVSSINSVVNVSQRANEITKTLKGVAEEGGQSVEKAINAIKEIEASTDQINQIITVMSSISDQTNMLAMNAAIEAAHAGQSGKGFAVVADEIRKLAESSTNSAKEIAQLIKAINQKITNAVDLAEKSGIGLNKILEDVNLTSEINSEIYSAMNEQSLGAKEILKSISSLLDITERVKSISTEQKDGTTKINDTIIELNDITNRIVKLVDEESQNSNEMQNAMQEINSISETNFEIVKKLNALITQIKVEDNKTGLTLKE